MILHGPAAAVRTWHAVLAIAATASFGAAWAADEERVPREIIVRHATDSHEPAGPRQRWLRPRVRVVPVEGDDRATPAEQRQRLQRAMDDWRRRPNVLIVEPNHYGRFEAVPPAAAPNDPEYSRQWWLNTVGGLGLWAVGRGSGIKVAVIDSGVSIAHPDLAASLEPDGYDFGDGDTVPDDGYGHGTGIAGVIGARADNGLGIAGIAPAARILPIKVSVGSTGQFDLATVIQAVDYAVAKGAQVINLSLVFDQSSELLRQSIQSALDLDIAVIAAAGNSGGAVAFPASMPGVIAVAGTDRQGALNTTSSRGPEIAIAAPGADIVTTSLGASYASRSGTSFATPMVTGAIAAMMSVNRAVPSATLLSLLRATATPVQDQSFGQLQAASAAAALLPDIALASGRFAGNQSFEAQFRLPPTGAPVDLYVAVSTPVGEFSLLPDCTWSSVTASGYAPFASGYRAAAALIGTLFGAGGVCAAIPLEGLPPGSYNWRVSAIANGGLVGAVNSEAMTISP